MSPSAEDAIRTIEKQERVEMGHVGYAGTPGRTGVELERITALGKGALPYLLRMAASRSPVARVAAAKGLLGRTEPEARAALAALAKDKAAVTTMRGCLVFDTTVGEAVAGIVKNG
jgi:hypothetical protein